MFFSISKKKLDNFPCHHNVNGKVINLDMGWKSIKINDTLFFYKGYCDQKRIEETLLEFDLDPNPKYSGVFCILIVRKDSITITHNLLRLFSIFIYENEISSLPNLKSFDSYQELENFYYLEISSSIQRKEIKNLITTSSNSLTVLEAVDQVNEILTNKFLNFYDQTKSKINLIVNGGLDSITIASYLYKLKIPCNISFNNYQEFSPFMMHNYDLIGDTYTNFKVHLTKDSVNHVAVGDWGDLAFGKDFCYSAFFKYQKIDPYKIINTDHYMYYFYHSTKNQTYYNTLDDDFEKYSLKKIRFKMLKDVLHSNNKSSVFHIDSNVYFVPFADIEIPKIIIELNAKDFIENLLDSSIQKELIKKNAPWMIDAVSKHKNINGRVKMFGLKNKFLEINQGYN